MQNENNDRRELSETKLEKSPEQISCGFSALFNSHMSALAAIKEIKETGLDMNKVSVAGRDDQVERNEFGFFKSGERIKHWGKLGFFWGGVVGLLSGPALFLLPGVGALFVAGQLISVLGDVIEGAAILGGASVLAAALVNLGINVEVAIDLESGLQAGKYVLLVRGTHDELKRAREIANNTGGNSIYDFDSKKHPIPKVMKFLN